ncbi:MAG: zinc ribbon domain-containing protein [Candidatus Aminicenantaceae bacterium]
MEIEFENLIDLQELDKKILNISAILENTPPQITEIDKKIDASAKMVADAKEKLAQNQKKRRDLESKAKDLKAQISRYKTQLNEVKTNREYSSLLKEIDEAQKQIDKIEDEIISEMLNADDIEEEIKAVTQKYNKEQNKLQKEKEAISQKKKELEIRSKELAQEREKLIHKIPPPQTKIYFEIFKKLNGVALSPVKDEHCSMCNVRVRPQVLNELRDRVDIILCENCGRVLYLSKKSG